MIASQWGKKELALKLVLFTFYSLLRVTSFFFFLIMKYLCFVPHAFLKPFSFFFFHSRFTQYFPT